MYRHNECPRNVPTHRLPLREPVHIDTIVQIEVKKTWSGKKRWRFKKTFKQKLNKQERVRKKTKRACRPNRKCIFSTGNNV